MSELRQNSVTGDWVLIATRRAKRPHFHSSETRTQRPQTAEGCPFCAGNEQMTPPETFALREQGTAPDTTGWQVRVVPNKFPALSSEVQGEAVDGELQRARPARGRHEVIIHSPNHHKSLALLSVLEIKSVLEAYKQRLSDVAKDPLISSALIIVNHGVEAGASISHPHSQLFALPIVAPLIERELERFESYGDETGGCLMCDVLEDEKKGGRIVAQNDHFLAFCPYASQLPFEICLAPKAHESDFLEVDDSLLEAHAEILKSVLVKLMKKLGDAPFNLYLHTKPFASEGKYHWHMVILPKTSIIAGFEFGTGIMINIMEPEAAAEFLR